MKLPRPKIHMIDVADPLFSFHNLICRCQLTLRNAEVKMMAAADMTEHCLPPIGSCLTCIETKPTADEAETAHYTYWLVEGEEEKSFQSEREIEAIA